MNITELIRESATDQEIRSFLTSYLDAVRYGDRLNSLSESVTHVPLTGLADVNRRVGALLAELDTASRQLDDRACTQIKEALRIFAAASDRLQRLAGENKQLAADTRSRA